MYTEHVSEIRIMDSTGMSAKRGMFRKLLICRFWVAIDGYTQNFSHMGTWIHPSTRQGARQKRLDGGTRNLRPFKI